MNAIIIDDIPAAIEALVADLSDYCPEVKVIGKANSVVSGAKLLQEVQPDLIFLDIEMEDGNGFDLLDIVGEAASHIIITSGSKEYAIKAFKYMAVDYLLKPIDPDELVAAVSKVKPRKVDPSNQLALHTAEEIFFIKPVEILYCKADGNYTHFNLKSGKTILVTKTLKHYEDSLPESMFVRVHQSFLVNINAANSFLKEDGGYLVMTNGDKIPVSVRKKTLVMHRISQRL